MAHCPPALERIRFEIKQGHGRPALFELVRYIGTDDGAVASAPSGRFLPDALRGLRKHDLDRMVGMRPILAGGAHEQAPAHAHAHIARPPA